MSQLGALDDNVVSLDEHRINSKKIPKHSLDTLLHDSEGILIKDTLAPEKALSDKDWYKNHIRDRDNLIRRLMELAVTETLNELSMLDHVEYTNLLNQLINTERGRHLSEILQNAMVNLLGHLDIRSYNVE